MPIIDLHTHSDYSDGTSSPEEVFHAALKNGVQIYALTDHDTTDGIPTVAKICQEHQVLFTCGVEISTRDHDHLHLIGYNVDITRPEFQAFLANNRQKRRTRIQQIILQLNQAGIELTEGEVFSRAPNTISRAHVADALKAKKYAQTRQDAFRKYLVPGQPGYVPSAGVSALEAIAHIKKAGGMAVLAHPGLTIGHWDFPAWTEAGLEGIEVFYPGHTYSLKQDLLSLASKYGLVATAGSDYHGPRGGRITTPGMQIPQNHYDKLLRKLFNR